MYKINRYLIIPEKRKKLKFLDEIIFDYSLHFQKKI